MRYHTNDIGQRAADIADREAEEVWKQTGDYRRWRETWLATYHSVLREFHSA